ncbi:MAG: tetratricopeptide repeat protein [Acidobacteria bacterium]|nr:tetratricopeptide repeat protein [Acidobacteriota bacterium]MCB9397218.1 tetratricopeptide repeat protein [Acidobacteriota bacterium]
MFVLFLFNFVMGADPNLIQTGRAQIFDRKFSEAQATFEQALAQDDQDLEALLGKIDALGFQRKTADTTGLANKHFSKSASKMQLVDAYIQIWNRQNGPASTALTALVDNAEVGYMANYLLGQLAIQNKDVDKAITYLTKSIGQNASYSESYYLLGEAYRQKNDNANVAKYWSTYLNKIQKSSRYDYVNQTLLKMGGR